MLRIVTQLLGLLALFASGASAEVDLAAGAARYTGCAGCHGERAEGNAQLRAPRLNHLQPVYLVSQLQKFRAGLRGGAGAQARQMAAVAANLPDEQALLDVAGYIAAQSSASSAATVAGDVQLGADYYNQFCGACHGPAGVGNVALGSPRLAGADDWYLLAQLQAFRSGRRGSAPGDREGRQMKAMAAVLPHDQAVADVVAYLRSLEP